MADGVSPPAMAGDIRPSTEHDDAVKLQKMDDNSSHRVLTPPTSEDMGKHEGHSSDLSDLEDEDEDDIGEVFPDHYWDEENGGRIPVFKPTMDQFRSFKKFVDKIDKYGMKSGIVKVIPPKEWTDNLPRLDEQVKSIKVKNPITQEFHNLTYGMYTQANIEKQRSYNLPQWKALNLESSHQPPAKRGERRRDVAPPKAKPARAAVSNPVVTPDGQKRRPGRPRKNPIIVQEVLADNVESDLQIPPTPTSPDRVEDCDNDEDEPTPAKRRRGRPGRPKKTEAKPAVAKPRGRQPVAADVKKSVSSRRMNNQAERDNEIDEESFIDFDYNLNNLDEFTKERCQELEEVYWKTITYNTPMYGADMPGSLFDERTTSWNVAQLENLLDVLGTKVPGVNTAYLYLGMWKATFAWHLEDVDLYSINYIHFGAPKQWYSISQEDARKFETAMKTLWPADFKNCDQFLRHKTYLISPEKLKSQFNIKVNKLVHYEGEFVITYPYGYHSGFNLGYNCAESVNFATEAWLDYGRIAKKCDCEADSVWVDVNEIERKLRGEPTPEYYEVTDDEDEEDRAPTPPPKAKKAATKKRKRAEPKEEAPKKKVKRVKIMVRVKGKEPCCLCPNDVKFDVLLPTDNGKQAHRLCAMYTPETYLVEDAGKEKVCGIANIDKERLALKCIYCHSKKGSCFQCASKKCARAFHATCAAAAGVLVDGGPVPTWDEDGTEYYCEGYDFRCRFHRPRRAKGTEVKNLEDNKLVRKYGKNLVKDEVVQALMLQGDIFAGIVVENRPTEGCVIIDVQPEGGLVEVEYKYLLTLDPTESQRPKPSPEAKPLPEHLSNKHDKVNADNRQDGVPNIGDPFHDPDSEQRWAEWNAANTAEIRNRYQKKINMATPNSLWYYLGRNSTEAKAQYTHDLRKRVHNTNSVFLDTVKEAAPKAIPNRLSNPSRPSYSSPSHGSYNSLRGQYPANYHTSYGVSNAGSYQQSSQLQAQNPARPYEYKPKTNIAPNMYQPNMPYGYGSPGFIPITSHPPSVPQYTAPTQGPTSSTPSYGNSSTGPTSYSRPPTMHVRAPSAHGPNPPRAPSAHGPNPSTPSLNQASHQPPRMDNSPPYRNFYQQAEQLYSRQQAKEPNYQALAAPSPQPRPAAPTATAVAPPFMPPSQRRHTSSLSTAEYLEHVKKYPYLKNSFLRRPQKYVSPYAAGIGFTPEWQAKLDRAKKPVVHRPSSSVDRKKSDAGVPSQSPKIVAPSPGGARNSYGPPAHSPPKPHSPIGSHIPVPQQLPRSQMLQYESPQQFQSHVSQEIHQQSGSPSGSWDYLLTQLKHVPDGHPGSSHNHDGRSGSPNMVGQAHMYGHQQPQQSFGQQQTSYYSVAPSAPSYNLPSLGQQQPWASTAGIGNFPLTSDMARTNSGGYSSNLYSGATNYPYLQQSYTPQDMRSPERPDYSPLSDAGSPTNQDMHVQGQHGQPHPLSRPGSTMSYYSNQGQDFRPPSRPNSVHAQQQPQVMAGHLNDMMHMQGQGHLQQDGMVHLQHMEQMKAKQHEAQMREQMEMERLKGGVGLGLNV
ncbi:hypothetical protein EJ08DRAFT_719833 [Tothia fuscella]|uniref:[histone H3]-trimethyl-L-lysine(9) demethylase n=1 Tax=Tothia fuscella TaxID=1048955 RepID=A0A9P4TWR2_9PEZI|nr:hypothetical protein EJ08DRAFT_719833 [Tothia fuscella]